MNNHDDDDHDGDDHDDQDDHDNGDGGDDDDDDVLHLAIGNDAVGDDDEIKNVKDLKGTNGIASDGILWRSENPIDQLGGFSLVASLHYGAHRF